MSIFQKKKNFVTIEWSPCSCIKKTHGRNKQASSDLAVLRFTRWILSAETVSATPILKPRPISNGHRRGNSSCRSCDDCITMASPFVKQLVSCEY